jgi:hypothetical protein
MDLYFFQTNESRLKTCSNSEWLLFQFMKHVDQNIMMNSVCQEGGPISLFWYSKEEMFMLHVINNFFLFVAHRTLN